MKIFPLAKAKRGREKERGTHLTKYKYTYTYIHFITLLKEKCKHFSQIAASWTQSATKQRCSKVRLAEAHSHIPRKIEMPMHCDATLCGGDLKMWHKCVFKFKCGCICHNSKASEKKLNAKKCPLKTHWCSIFRHRWWHGELV